MLSTNKTSASASWIKDLLLLALVLGVFYALWIGSHPLFTPDEGRYSEVAREMVATGDYITPRVNGVAFLDKPILYYWLQASAIKLFGVKEWSVRFWPSLIGVLGCLVLYSTGRILFSRRTGLIAACIIATCPVYYGAAHYANLDLEVAVWISSCLLFSICALQTTNEKYRKIFFIIAYVFCGFAALTKGLIGIVFPTMIIGTWILILNRWAILKKMHLALGLVIFLLITIPWYTLVQKANPEFFHYFFINQQVSRFLTHGEYNNQTPVWFYIPVVLLGFFPWSVFAIQALVKICQSIWRNRQTHAAELFLVLWFFIVFVFFSIPTSKTIGYIIPVFPVLALIVAQYLDSIWHGIKNTSFTIGCGIFIFMSILLVLACLIAPHISYLHISTLLKPHLIFTMALYALAATITLILLQKPHLVRNIIIWLTTIAAISMLTLSISAKYLNNKSVKPIALWLKETVKPTDEVVTYFKYYQDLPMYLERRITIVADWTSPTIPYSDNWVRELWYGMAFQDTRDWLIADKTFWERWYSDKRLFVLMSKHDYEAFADKAKNTAHFIMQHNNVVLVSNKNLSHS